MTSAAQEFGQSPPKTDVISAYVAEKPCKLVGNENDWRFEKNTANESRLLRFWRSIGFESFEPNKNVVKIETAASNH